MILIHFDLKYGPENGFNPGRGVVTGLWPRSCFFLTDLKSDKMKCVSISKIYLKIGFCQEIPYLIFIIHVLRGQYVTC